MPNDIKKIIYEYSPIFDENIIKNVLRCAGADASRNISTRKWSIEKGLNIVLGHKPTISQIETSLNNMPNEKNWYTMVLVGWYMNSSDTPKYHKIAMEKFKESIIAGIMNN
tara:strand:- start:77 stop:409 length:333 start_codon:yes stop_codon:yes gene_type:complete